MKGKSAMGMEFNLGKRGGVRIRPIKEGSKSEDKLFMYAHENAGFDGKLGQCFFLGDIEGRGDFLLGLGKDERVKLGTLRDAFYQAGKKLAAYGVEEVEIDLKEIGSVEGPCGKETSCNRSLMSAIAEGLIHSSYRFDKYKSEKREKKDMAINIISSEGDEEELCQTIENTKILMEAVFMTRDLVNEPANVIYPETLAETAKTVLEPLSVSVKVYDEKEVEKLGMEAFLSVARGSSRPPRLIVMEYKGDPDSSEKTALVGKGLTYDSGGYSIKPSNGMKTMKSDMAGGATVIGTISALAKMKAKVNVIGITAACENLVSGHSYKPGDVIGSLSGKTIEVDNTDAEGRLTLADAVTYATENLDCDRVIDLATLTGSCLAALGEEYTGAVSNNSDFLSLFLDAAKRAGERVWELPNDDDFAKRNESEIADIKNSGGFLGGTISAGLFVGAFVKEGIPWIHLDIAGTAFLSKAQHYMPEGATGIMVKTLVDFLTL